MEQPIYQVSDLIAVINQSLEYAYPGVIVEGEVASFKFSKNKYVFFDIKDDQGVMSCFMMVYQLRVALEDGMRVRLLAQPRLTAWGKFSLTVREVLPVGEGSIKRSFALLQAKLEAEGLFDQARKRILPQIPQRIALVASVESAGYADFIKILNSRWGGVEVVVADVQVQGVSAASQIIRAIDYLNRQSELADVLVIVRGGGSAEDLAVFNDEALVRAVAASRIPTLVGVGHEVDTTLCDLAADVRAATPTNAAQIIVPDRQALIRELGQRERRLYERMVRRVADLNQRVDQAAATMLRTIDRARSDWRRRLQQAQLVLRQLDPKVVLQRGYALVRDAKGALIKTGTRIKVGDKLTIQAASAILKVGVTDVESKI